MRRLLVFIGVLSVVVAVVLGGISDASGLPAEIESALGSSKYVYIASTRKDGSLGKPAEIWFLYHNGAVYVGTPSTTWRVRRIKAGRQQAKIWVGKMDGPALMATGAVVKEPDTEAVMMETFAKKYPDGWGRYEQKFRSGFKDGGRVLVKYTPQGS